MFLSQIMILITLMEQIHCVDFSLKVADRFCRYIVLLKNKITGAVLIHQKSYLISFICFLHIFNAFVCFFYIFSISYNATFIVAVPILCI